VQLRVSKTAAEVRFAAAPSGDNAYAMSQMQAIVAQKEKTYACKSRHSRSGR